jgi:hypothetical protein
LPKGVKGIHPLGCLPLWGREGVTFVFFLSNEKMNKIRFSTEPDYPFCAGVHKNRSPTKKYHLLLILDSVSFYP